MALLPELITALESERTGAQALLTVLAEERGALSASDADCLAETARRKRELLLRMAQLSEKRIFALERCGVSADRRGMETLLKAHGSPADLRAEWRTLLDITEKARRLNQENGVLIDARLRANQHALSALISAGAPLSTYGPGGRALAPLSSRTFVSA